MTDVVDITGTYLMGRLLNRDGEFCQGAPLVPLPYYTFYLPDGAQIGEGNTGNSAEGVAYQHDNQNKKARRDSPIAYSDKYGKFVFFASDNDDENDKNLAGTPVALFKRRNALFFPSYLVTIAQGYYGKNWSRELTNKLNNDKLRETSIVSLEAKEVRLNKGLFLSEKNLVDNQLTRDYIDWHKSIFRKQKAINVVTVPQYYTIVLTFSSDDFVGGRVSLTDFTDKVMLTGDDVDNQTRNQPASFISEVTYINHEGGSKKSKFIAATFWVETELLGVPLTPSELFCRFDIDLRTVRKGDDGDAKVKALTDKGIPLTYSLKEQVLHLPIHTIAGRSALLNGDPISVEEALINHAPEQFSALLSAINKNPTPIKEKKPKESDPDFLPAAWHNLQTHKSQYQAVANTLEKGLNWDVISQTYHAAFGQNAVDTDPWFKLTSRVMGISGSASSFLKMVDSFAGSPAGHLTTFTNSVNLAAKITKIPHEMAQKLITMGQRKIEGQVMSLVPTRYHAFLGGSKTIFSKLGGVAAKGLDTPLSVAELAFNINSAIEESTKVEENNKALTSGSHKYALNVQSISKQGVYTSKKDFSDHSKKIELVKAALVKGLKNYKQQDGENVTLVEKKDGGVIAQLLCVNFKFDKASIILNNEDDKIFETIAEYLRLLPDPIFIEVIGHTCAIGSDKYNRKLSLERAETFKALLIEKIKPSEDLKLLWEFRIGTKGEGASKPLDKDDLERNRRVEVVFLFNSAPQYPPCRSGIAALEKQRRITVTSNISEDTAVIAAASSGVDVLLGLGAAFLGPASLVAYSLWWAGTTLKTGFEAYDELASEDYKALGKLKSSSEFSSATQYMMLANDGKAESAAFLKKAYLKRALAINGLMRLIHRFHYEKGRHTSGRNTMYDMVNALSANLSDDELFESFNFQGYIEQYLLSDDWSFSDSYFPVYLDEVWLESIAGENVSSFASFKSYLQGAVFVKNRVLQDGKSSDTLTRGEHYKSTFPIHYLNSTNINFFKNLFVDKLPNFKDVYKEQKLISDVVISVRPRGAKTLTDWIALPTYLKKNPVLSPFDQIRILVIFNNENEQFKELLDDSEAPLMVPVSARPIRYNLVSNDTGPATKEYVSLLKEGELCEHEKTLCSLKEPFENIYGAIIQPTFKFGQNIIAGTRPMAAFDDSSLSELFSKEGGADGASGHYEMDYFYEVFIPSTKVKLPVAYGSKQSWYGESDVKLFPVSLDPERKYSVPTKSTLGVPGKSEEQDDYVFYEENFLSAQNTENRTAPKVFDDPKIVFSLYQGGQELTPEGDKGIKKTYFNWDKPADLQALIYTKSFGTENLIKQGFEPDVFPVELFLRSREILQAGKYNILKLSQRQSIHRIGHISTDGVFKAVTTNDPLADDFSVIKGKLEGYNDEQRQTLLQQEGVFVSEPVNTDVFAVKLELDYYNALGIKVKGLKPVKDLGVLVDKKSGGFISLELEIRAKEIGLTNAYSQKLAIPESTIIQRELPKSWYEHTDNDISAALARMETNNSSLGDDEKIEANKKSQSESGVSLHLPQKIDEWIEAGNKGDTHTLTDKRRKIIKDWIGAKQ